MRAAGFAGAVTVDDATLRQIVGRHLDIDAIAGKNADVVAAQTAGDVGQDGVAVFELDRERRAGEDLLDRTEQLERGLFGIFDFDRGRLDRAFAAGLLSTAYGSPLSGTWRRKYGMGRAQASNRKVGKPPPMLRGIVLGVVLTLAALFLGGYVVISTGLFPANADARPGSLERWIANTSLDATVSREAKGLKPPIGPTEADLVAGVKTYGENCAVCHGVAKPPGTNISRGFYQRAPQFTRRRGGPTEDPVEETYWKITHGIRLTAMPHFSTTLDDTQRWQVALMLKNLKSLPPKAEKAWQALRVTEALAPPLTERGPARP